MPVGHAVTATRRRRPAGTSAACRVAAVAGARDAGEEVAAAGCVAGAASSTSETRAAASSGVPAERRAAVKSGFTSARASWVSSTMWVLSPPSGARIRKARSAGPSLAPKSTGGESRARATVGSATAAVRQWGMAMPPGRPVADFASRAKASATTWSTSSVRPASRTTAASPRIVASLSSPKEWSSRTSAAVMMGVAGMLTSRWCGRAGTTSTPAGSTWCGNGIVVPGRPAAALPYATARARRPAPSRLRRSPRR